MADTTPGQTLPALSPDDIEIIDDEPRVTDTRLAAFLGYAEADNLRELANRHREALERFGGISPYRTEKFGRGRPRSGMAFNKKQAFFLGGKSDLPNGIELLIQMVEVFDAATSGRALPPLPPRATLLPPPEEPPFCGECYAKEMWRSGQTWLGVHPLHDGPIDLPDLEVMRRVRDCVAHQLNQRLKNKAGAVIAALGLPDPDPVANLPVKRRGHHG